MQMTSTVIWSMPDKNFEILLLSTLMHIKSKFTLVHTKGEVHTNSKASSSKPNCTCPSSASLEALRNHPLRIMG